MEELAKIEGIKEVRGLGLMIGIEFETPIKDIRRKLLFEKHIFTGVSGNQCDSSATTVDINFGTGSLFY